jgi:hypothetical protein
LREENTLQRDIFGCVREEVTGDWRKYLSEELHDLYCSPYVDIVVMKSRTDGRGMWHVRGRRKMHTGLWWGTSKERGHWECVGVCGWIILTTARTQSGLI